MAVVNLKSSLVTNSDAALPIKNSVTDERGRVRNMVMTLETNADDSVGSVYRAFRVRSNWRLLGLYLKSDAIATAPAADIGLYRTAADGGAVVTATTYGTAVLLSAAITTAELNQLYEARDINRIAFKVWQDAGATVDPVIDYDLALTLTVATTAIGTVSLSLVYVID